MKTTISKKIPWQKLFRHLIPNAGTLVLMALMLFAYNAWAAPHQATSAQETSSTFSYQGTLADTNGNPITGDVDITFRLYTVATDGTALWEEVRTGTNAVPVDNGLFQIMLGAVNPIPNSIWQNDPLYLGVQVGADPEMTPRELVGKSPRALVADVALTVPDGAITPEKLADNVLPFTLSTLDTSYVVVEEERVAEVSSWDFGNVPAGDIYLSLRISVRSSMSSHVSIALYANDTRVSVISPPYYTSADFTQLNMAGVLEDFVGGTINVRVDAKNPAGSGTAITFGSSNGIDQRYGRQLTGIAGLRH